MWVGLGAGGVLVMGDERDHARAVLPGRRKVGAWMMLTLRELVPDESHPTGA